MLHNYKCKLYYKHKITFLSLKNIQFLTLINNIMILTNKIINITILKMINLNFYDFNISFMKS